MKLDNDIQGFLVRIKTLEAELRYKDEVIADLRKMRKNDERTIAELKDKFRQWMILKEQT